MRVVAVLVLITSIGWFQQSDPPLRGLESLRGNLTALLGLYLVVSLWRGLARWRRDPSGEPQFG